MPPSSRRSSAEIESLFAGNLAPLRAFVRVRMGSALRARESVDDLVQSVCREVITDLEDFEDRGRLAFRKWLFLQATRKILDRKRYYESGKRSVAREVSPRGDADEDFDELLTCYVTLVTPSRHATAKEEVERVERCLRQLPAGQRDAVTMTRILGLSTEEVARQMGRTPSAVRGLVARGLARLSSML